MLLITNFFTQGIWFWTVYLIQVMNLSGATGDYYVATKMLRLSKDILVQDTGIHMTVYERAFEQTETTEE